MSGNANSIFEAAKALSREERADVAARLLDTLEDEVDAPVDQAAIDVAWGAEADRRYQSYLRGEMKAVPIQQVLDKLARRENP